MRKLCIKLNALLLIVSSLFITSWVNAASTFKEFQAELSFAATTTIFDVALYEMSSNKPGASDTKITGKLVWLNGKMFKSDLLPGSRDYSTYPGDDYSIPQSWWSTSKIYAKISTNSAIAGAGMVKMYTDNTNSSIVVSSTSYKYDISKGTAALNALVPMVYDKIADTVTFVGLPVLYQVVFPDTKSLLKSTVSTTTYTLDEITSVGEVYLNAVAEDKLKYGMYYLTDKATNGYTDVHCGIAGGYTVIMNVQGVRTGDDGTVFHTSMPRLGRPAYIFFATSAHEAFYGTRYGTDKLVFEIITE